jgi:hypothetical protein
MTPFAICLFAGTGLVVLSFILMRHAAEKGAEDPRVILRRCRLELHAVRGELSMLPAGKEMHAIFREIENACHTIDLVEREYAKGQWR